MGWPPLALASALYTMLPAWPRSMAGAVCGGGAPLIASYASYASFSAKVVRSLLEHSNIRGPTNVGSKGRVVGRKANEQRGKVGGAANESLNKQELTGPTARAPFQITTDEVARGKERTTGGQR